MKALLMGAMATALLASTAAHAQMKPEDMVEARKAGYQFMAWNMGKIKAQVIDGKEPFDQAKVAAAANAIAGIANSGMGALYAPGTDKGTGWKETRLKSEFFAQPDKVREVGMNFVQQANKLQEVAASGDKAAVAAQFGEVGKACKACHENFRKPE